jgi:parallel beta-helix repeat protein
MENITYSLRCISTILILCISIVFSQPFNKSNKILEEILVNNTNDNGPGSLRQAIYAANHFLHINSNIIRFNIPTIDPGYDSNNNIWVIKPDSSFEFIVDRNLTIDGFSQSSFIGSDLNPLGPEIVIDGSNAGTNTTAFATSGESTDIYGLTINRFDGSGIMFLPPGIGTVSGCYLGTDFSGMNKAGNRFGISMIGRVVGVHIGPSEYVFPNIISGNTQSGIFISDSASHNVIVGNNIGLNREGTATISNDLHGISLQNICEHNEIVRNMIGGNLEGILIINSNSNLVASNLVGTNKSLDIDFGNGGSGITIWSNSSHNSIVNNIIGFNNNGISVDSPNSLQNVISRNNISHNFGLGLDNKNGGNMELAPPIIINVNNNEINGESAPNQIIEIFADAEDEGMIFIDSTVANPEGNFYLSISDLPELPHITATARDNVGNTSEFSTPYLVTDVEENPIPQTFHLSQNYPNPFNPSTIIRYELPVCRHTTIRVYDLLGNEIVLLVNKEQAAGKHQVNFNSEGLVSGIYFYKLNTKSLDGTKIFSAVKKMMILR